MWLKKSHFNKRKTCSRACMGLFYKTELKGNKNPNFRNLEKKICGICSKEYESYNKNRKFCGVICGAINNRKDPGVSRKVRERKEKKIIKKRVKERIQRLQKKYLCPFCNVEQRKKGRKMCKSCHAFKTRMIEKECPKCKKKFETRCATGRRKFHCSNKCRTEDLQGSKNPNWKGGKKTESQKIRSSKEYSDWRTRVFERDGFKCIWCGKFSGTLNADHIKPFSLFPELRFSIDNGRTLCVPCHKKTDSYLKKTYRKDYDETELDDLLQESWEN